MNVTEIFLNEIVKIAKTWPKVVRVHTTAGGETINEFEGYPMRPESLKELGIVKSEPVMPRVSSYDPFESARKEEAAKARKGIPTQRELYEASRQPAIPKPSAPAASAAPKPVVPAPPAAPKPAGGWISRVTGRLTGPRAAAGR